MLISVETERLVLRRAAGRYGLPPDDIWEGDEMEYALTRAEWERQEAAAQAARTPSAGASAR